MGQLAKLKGLGAKSEADLNAIGIFTREDLEKTGAAQAFLALRGQNPKTSLNFLYAMVGALEDRNWLDIAQSEKGKLLMELEDIGELRELIKAEGLEVNPSP